MYEVMIVEDDLGSRQRLERAVANHSMLELGASVDCLEDAVTALQLKVPHVLLVDLGLPDGSGVDLIRMARQKENPPECMVVTMCADQNHLMRALEAGATGYLLKDALPEDVAQTIMDLIRGGSPISPLIARALLRRFDSIHTAQAPVEQLTSRETEVLEAMAQGLSRKEIAMKLSVSVHTVHFHVKHIYEKFAVKSNIEAVRKAQSLHLLADTY